MPTPVLTNFRVAKLDNTKGLLDQAKEKWASPEFISSNDLWLASFEMNGETHHAGVRLGRRVDVAEDINQIDIQLGVREEAFDADKFIPEWEVADITRAVYDEFLKLLPPDSKPALANQPQ
jgi:hypothetical protein